MTRQHPNQSGVHATLNQSIPCLSWMLMLGVIMALNLQLKAAQLTWNGNASNWSQPSGWQEGVIPTAEDEVMIISPT
ncbi:MAG: hypothetical protein VW804_06775, partial [Verrucomicrobiota bacterium]